MAAATQTLQGYINTCRMILHDANAAFYSNAQLTQFINDARYRLVRDSGCLRAYQTSSVVNGQEVYQFSSLPQGNVTYDIMNINLIWGNSRVPLYYLPWTDFNAKLRYWTNYIGRPIAYSMYDSSTSFYIGPVPDQTYPIELDTVILPTPLVNLTDVDTIPDNYISPVPYYAAHQAKFMEQAYGESEIFRNQYLQKMQNVIATSYQRRIFSPYVQPVVG
jgi:hypothetical protein